LLALLKGHYLIDATKIAIIKGFKNIGIYSIWEVATACKKVNQVVWWWGLRVATALSHGCQRGAGRAYRPYLCKCVVVHCLGEERT
jgi:hypothetical protein